MTVYKIDIHDRRDSDGLLTWVVKGQPVTVDGVRMVKLAHGTIVPADGFVDTLAEAKQEAARQIEMIGHRVLAQADRLRAEAAKEEVAA